MSELKIIVAPVQSEKICTGCHFNKGEDDPHCYKYDDGKYTDVECYDNERSEHLIFKLESTKGV